MLYYDVTLDKIVSIGAFNFETLRYPSNRNIVFFLISELFIRLNKKSVDRSSSLLVMNTLNLKKFKIAYRLLNICSMVVRSHIMISCDKQHQYYGDDTHRSKKYHTSPYYFPATHLGSSSPFVPHYFGSLCWWNLWMRLLLKGSISWSAVEFRIIYLLWSNWIIKHDIIEL